MLFRPSFCANCGEKIERAEWSIWTSRRFCQVCETEFKGHDLILRVLVGLGVLAGIFGFGSYLKSGSTADTLASRQPRKFVEQTAPVAQVGSQPGNTNSAVAKPPDAQNTVSIARTLTGPQTSSELRKAEPEEPMYYCGAETKKGTPCSRRVKGNIRCYQHVGMPAMLPAEKLKIK